MYAAVRLGYDDNGLLIEVADDGGPRPDRPAARSEGSGNGIAGMAERAAALGGTLDAGPRPEGGFRVRAWLPFSRGFRAVGLREGHDGESREAASPDTGTGARR